MADELLRNNDGDPVPQRLQEGASPGTLTGDTSVWEPADPTVPDGANEALGATGDSAVTDPDGSGTLLAYIKGLVSVVMDQLVMTDEDAHSGGDPALPLAAVNTPITSNPVDTGDWGPVQASDEGGLWVHGVDLITEDTQHSSGANARPMAGVRNDEDQSSLVNNDGDWTLFQTNGQGRLRAESQLVVLDSNGEPVPLEAIDDENGEPLLRVADQNALDEVNDSIQIFGHDGQNFRPVMTDEDGHILTKEAPVDVVGFAPSVGATANTLYGNACEVIGVWAGNVENANEPVYLKFFDADSPDLANDMPRFALPLPVESGGTMDLPNIPFSTACTIAATTEPEDGATAPSVEPTVSVFIRT